MFFLSRKCRARLWWRQRGEDAERYGFRLHGRGRPLHIKKVSHNKKPGWLARLLLRRVGCGYITARRDWR
jgi:hypothetical protein